MRKYLARCFGAVRWTYNRCVEESKNPERVEWLTKTYLRGLFVTEKALKGTKNAWALEIPEYVRDTAIQQFAAARKAQYERDGFYGSMTFRSRKDYSQTILVSKKMWKTKSTKAENTLPFNYKTIRSKHLPKILKTGATLQKTRLGHYFMCIPWEHKEKYACEKSKKLHSTIALDPGSRTFMTGYDADGLTVSIGYKSNCRLFNLCRHYDKLESKKAKSTHFRKRNISKALKRQSRKIRNLVDEVHRKFAKWLCKSYRRILIPKFEVKQMTTKSVKRRIGSKTARMLYTWSHYRFREHLKKKCKEHPDCKINVCTEEYTSKTCGNCGLLDYTLGGKEVFNCRNCGFEADRDVNGARNILLLYLTKKKELDDRKKQEKLGA